MTHDAIGLVRICRHIDGHAEDVSQDSDVIDALVSPTVFSHIEAQMRACDLQMRVIDVTEAMLVVGLAHSEDTEIREYCSDSAGREGSCTGGRVMFLDPGLKEMIGEPN